MTIEQAIIIATQAHLGQVDKAGEPYILHPIFVMSRMKTNDERVVAILHDVIKDTPIWLQWLTGDGLTQKQATALRLLTHNRDVSYEDYIRKLSINPIARAVKIVDLRHNLDLERLKGVDFTKDQEDRMIIKQKQYVMAYMYLTCI